MSVIGIRLFCGLLIFVLSCAAAWAQATAQISGSVTDQTRAVLPGVEVTVTQTATGAGRTAITNETGSYVLPNLPLGPYRLEAALPGFRTYVQTGIVLEVGQNLIVSPVLEVGQVAETVEVQAEALQVETRNTALGQVMDNVRVLELPLNGRQATELITLSGPALEGAARGTDRFYPTIAVSVGGGQDNTLTYRLDGGTHNDPFGNLNFPLPFPDALQEFKLETSAIPARHGQHSSGLVSVVTKSGTNEFHGSLFEFVRNEAFNARNTFSTEGDGLKRNQFGGTIGGPIVTNKLFFFAGYQGTIQRSKPSSAFSFIPTQEMLNGDWTRVASSECRSRPVQLRAPFVNNRINPALYSPVALNILKKIPSTSHPCGEIRYGRLNNSTEDIFVSRVDYQKSNAHSMFVRYTLHQLDTPTDYDGQNVLSSSNPDYIRRFQSGVFGDTLLIGTNVVNTFRVTGLRARNDKTHADFFNYQDVGVKNIYQPEGFAKMLLLSISGGFNLFSAPATPSFLNHTTFEVSNDLGWTKGNHQLAFGGSFLRHMMNISANTATPGTYNFRGNFTGIGLADFMLGNADEFTQGVPSTWYPRQHVMALFAQDTWSARPGLTLNLGVRWEPYLPQWRKDNRMGRFRLDWFEQGLKSQVFDNAPKGYLYSGGPTPPGIPGDPRMPENTKVSKNQWTHFAPRVGIAWDPARDGRMTIRSAYGIFFDYPHMYQFNGIRSLPPFDIRVTRTNIEGGLEDPWRGYPGGSPFPFVVTKEGAPFPPGSLMFNVPEDFKSPYAHQWNLSVQRQINPEWLATANYLGTSVIHVLAIKEENPQIDGVRVLTRIDPQSPYSFINKFDDGGTSSYNALWFSLERRAPGMNVRLNYTWSHCIDEGSDVHSHGSRQESALRRRENRGNCDLDRRHNFNLSTVYRTPEFANPTVRALAGGWQISGLIKALSGRFFDVICNCDNARSGATSDQRAQQLLPNVYTASRSLDAYLNPAAFGTPAAGTYGNVGRNSIQGPGRFSLDVGLTRTFAIRENQSLQFRAEAFNLPNHVNLNNPNATITSSDFGRVTSAGEPRIMQFALKYVF